MAWTVSVLRKDIVGSHREFILSCTADAAEQAVDTGLSYVYGFAVGQVSCATGAPHIRLNQGSTSTALNGFLGCSGFVSGDVLLLTVKGR